MARSDSPEALRICGDVVEALPVAAYLTGPDGYVTHVSRGWEQFTGGSAAEVLSCGYALIHPDDLNGVVTAWVAARAAGGSCRVEFRLRFGDGSYRWVVSQAAPVREADDAIVAWFGTVTEVHDRRLAQDARAETLGIAHERANVLERLLEASDDRLTVLTLDARLVFMSIKGQKALGITDFSAVKGTDWLRVWTEEHRGAAQAAAATARAGGRGRFTGRFAAERGERWWDVAVTPILDDAGRPEQLLAVSRDITETLVAQRELGRSEERYRLLTESLPGTAWTATPDGLLDHIGEGTSQSVRRPIASRLGDVWLEGVHPDDRERVRALWRARVESGEPYETQFRVRMADGGYRWKLVRAMPQHDDHGSVVRWVGVNVDIDDQRRADEERERFVALAQNSGDIIGITDPDGNVVYANPAARRLLSLDDPRSIHFLECFSPEDREFVTSVVVPAMEREGRWVGEFRMRNFRTGASIPILYNAFVLTDAGGKKMGLATISRDLRERRRIDVGLRALADTAAAMYGSLDYEETLGNVADAVMKTFATCCTIDVLDGDGTYRRVAVAHPRADMRAVFGRYTDQTRFQPGHPVIEAIRRGTSTCVSELGPEWAARQTPSLVDAAATLRIRSFISVPVRAPDGAVLGALTCSLDLDDPRPSYVPDDVPFAEELGRRAGIAVQHARAYARERAIAMRFQEASLPSFLPTVEHVSLSADYRPGHSEATIGGDWYDAFLLKDGRVAISIGDVVGKGLNAAVTMAQVRQSMRSAAALLPDPNAMLTAAASTVRDLSADNYATAIAGIIDPRSSEFIFACAGHPGPASVSPDGSVHDHTARGAMLGLRTSSAHETVTLSALSGSALVFFTDGLTEATRDIDEGYRRLHAALSDPAVAAAENPARAVVDHVLRGQAARDDIAVLVARISARGQNGPHAPRQP